ncbi:hypothetical protein DFQ30_002663, partial [Apophysomyces sp. BC1015]
MKDIYNLRGKMFKISRSTLVADVLDFLQNRGYSTRYELNDNHKQLCSTIDQPLSLIGHPELKSLFVFHPGVVHTALRFSEVV